MNKRREFLESMLAYKNIHFRDQKKQLGIFRPAYFYNFYDISLKQIKVSELFYEFLDGCIVDHFILVYDLNLESLIHPSLQQLRVCHEIYVAHGCVAFSCFCVAIFGHDGSYRDFQIVRHC